MCLFGIISFHKQIRYQWNISKTFVHVGSSRRRVHHSLPAAPRLRAGDVRGAEPARPDRSHHRHIAHRDPGAHGDQWFPTLLQVIVWRDSIFKHKERRQTQSGKARNQCNKADSPYRSLRSGCFRRHAILHASKGAWCSRYCLKVSWKRSQPKDEPAWQDLLPCYLLVSGCSNYTLFLFMAIAIRSRSLQRL